MICSLFLKPRRDGDDWMNFQGAAKIQDLTRGIKGLRERGKLHRSCNSQNGCAPVRGHRLIMRNGTLVSSAFLNQIVGWTLTSVNGN